jgi:hypothetical protein
VASICGKVREGRRTFSVRELIERAVEVTPVEQLGSVAVDRFQESADLRFVGRSAFALMDAERATRRPYCLPDG